MRKVYLGLQSHSQSTRCPHKAGRLIQGVPLFRFGLDRCRHFIKADGEFAIVPEGYADDLLAYTIQQMGIEVVRTGRHQPTGRYRYLEAINKLGLDDDDIVVRLYTDEPLSYCEDTQYRIEVFQDSDKEWAMSAPTDIFPIRDCEWACGPHINEYLWKVSLFRNKYFDFHSNLHRGTPWSKEPLEALRLFLRSGIIQPLFFDKPIEAKEPWPHQPLWIDEAEHFELTKKLFNYLDSNTPPTLAQVKAVLEQHPRLYLGIDNAPRRTIHPLYEDFECVQILKELAATTEVYPSK